MKSASASSVERDARAVLVWDAPLRVFHWLLAASFAGAWLTAESDRLHVVHLTLGYTVAGLVAFRVLWGLVGTRHARFASFVRGPRAVLGYLRSLVGGRPEHHAGHNPAGALAIVALLLLATALTATGWGAHTGFGGRGVSELHEGIATAMLALVGVHVAAVAISSWLHRENLVRAMVTGRKAADRRDGIRRTWRGLAAAMLVTVLGFWWLQWEAPAADAMATAARHGWATMAHHGDDDD